MFLILKKGRFAIRNIEIGMDACEKMLIKHFGLLAFLLAIAIIVIVGGFILCIKMKLAKPLAVFLICCMLVLTAPIIYIVMGFCDLHEQAYVVYHGDFTVSDRFQLNGNLMLHDGNQTSVHMQGDFSLPNGEHTGYVVYSERTHLLLAYDPNDNPLNRK